jgi:lipid-binding SYLF domain-containing protein
MLRRTMLLAGAGLVAGCASSTDPAQASARRREIDVAVDSALGDLFTNVQGARAVVAESQGILVFPEVFTAGLLVGGSHGHGALLKGTQTLGYYALNSGSVGLLAGAQTRTLYVIFVTPEAMNRFLASDGWTMGGDASVVVVDAGAMSRLDKGNRPSIIGLARNQQGFMASFSLDGTKISKLKI